MNPQREAIITAMMEDMAKGLSSKDSFAVIELLWGLKETTFKSYWLDAAKRFNIINIRDQARILRNAEDSAEERRKRNILQKLDRMEILSSIARGEIPLVKYIVCDGTIQERDIVADYSDRRAAIAELNKMDGDYAPIKKDITTQGEKINMPAPPITVTIVPPSNDD